MAKYDNPKWRLYPVVLSVIWLVLVVQSSPAGVEPGAQSRFPADVNGNAKAAERNAPSQQPNKTGRHPGATPTINQTSCALARPITPDSIEYGTLIDANDLTMLVSNVGSFAYDIYGIYGSSPAALYYPSGSNNTLLYSGGLWLGGMVGTDVRVSLSEFSSTYVPGPMVDGSFVPDADSFHVYKIIQQLYDEGFYDRNRPPQDDSIRLWDDYHYWPTGQGAPVDVNGDPDFIGDQTLWCVYNDASDAAHTNSSGSMTGLGVEIQQTTFAVDGNDDFGKMIFIKYLLINKGGNSITDMYAGFWADPDLGSANDDYGGCDSTLDLGYTYNATNSDNIYGAAPPTLGYRFLPPGGTVAASSDDFHISSYLKFINGTDPYQAQESYYSMLGLDKSGNSIIDPISSYPTRFMFSGDPIAGTGWIDCCTTPVSTYQVELTIEETAGPGGVPVDPPDNVAFSWNSTGEFYISSDQTDDFDRMNWRGEIEETDAWEFRFTAGGSEYYDWSTEEIWPDRVPFEVWNIGSETPDDPSDDRRLQIFSIDDDESGSWTVGDRTYVSEQDYYEPLPQWAEYTWPDDLHIGRIVFNGSVPQEGTIVRFTPTKIDTLFDTVTTSGDIRFILSAGPFNMAPEDTQEVGLAIIVGQGQNNFESVIDLKWKAAEAADFWATEDWQEIPHVVSVSPEPYDPSVPADANVSATFDINVTSTLQDWPLQVYGTISGSLTGMMTYDDLNHILTLDPSTEFLAGEEITAVLPPDIQSLDGIPLDRGYVWSFTSAVASGSGWFSDVVELVYDYGFSDICIADFNRDGIVDFAASHPDVDTISVFENDGAYTYTYYRYTANSPATSLTPGDFNGDGYPDLAAITPINSQLIILLNDGTGGFSSPLSRELTELPDMPDKMISGEFNGDGNLDLLLVDTGATLMLGNGNGSFTAQLIYGIPFGDDLATGDWDNDGDLDLIVAYWALDGVKLYYRQDDGMYTTGASITTGDNPTDIAVADFNDDGYADFIVAHQGSGNITIHLNDGSGGFTKSEYSTGLSMSAKIRPADFNGDGAPDLSVLGYQDNRLFILINDGYGAFTNHDALTFATTTIPIDHAVLDLNVDGALDILAITGSSRIAALAINLVNLYPPVISTIGDKQVDEGQNLNFIITATDADGTPPEWRALNRPAGATFTDNGDGTGTFDFTPQYNQADTYHVSFIASDGYFADTALVEITVNNVNRAPWIANIPDTTINEGVTLQLQISATDPDSDSLTFARELATVGALDDHGDGSATFTFSPDYTQADIYTIRFIVSDGDLADTDLTVITVNDVKRAPVIEEIPDTTIVEAQTLLITVRANDIDGDNLTLTAPMLPVSNATFVNNNDNTGQFTFTPDYQQAGIHNVRFAASDGTFQDTEDLVITVTNVPRPPVVTSIPEQTLSEGITSVNITLDDYVSDLDHGDASLTWTSSSVAGNFSVLINNRVARITAKAGSHPRADILTFTAKDPDGQADSAEVTVRMQGSDLTILPSLPANTYRMFTLPVQPTDSRRTAILDELSGTEGVDWRVGRWNASTGGYQSSISTLETGKAYWIISAKSHGALTVSGTAEPPYRNITIQPGWNQIGTPTMYDINFLACQVIRSGNVYAVQDDDCPVRPVLYHWNGNGYDSLLTGQTIRMEAGEGYWIYLDGPCAGCVLRFSPMEYGTTETAAKITDGQFGKIWSARIRAQQGSRFDNSNYFGTMIGADNNLDRYDFPEPPTIGGDFALVFAGELTTDYRKTVVPGDSWQFTVRTEQPGLVQLTIDLTDFPQQSAGLLLIDQQSGTIVDVLEENTYRYFAQPGARPFSISVTDASSSEMSESGKPQAFALFANYPNPFNTHTLIEYTLDSDAMVSLEIFDILGRKIRCLVDRHISAGRHAVAWDGRDDRGSEVSSGIFFYRLKANGQSQARKMTMMK